MKKAFVWIIVVVLCLFLCCIPKVCGGDFERYYNSVMECVVFGMIADKVVKWIFG